MSSINSPFKRIKAHLENFFLDHEILRMLYRNFYALSPTAFRSNHPSKAFLKKLQTTHQLKTVVSMRKANTSASYLFEKEACEQLGITLIHHPMSSQKLPKPEMVVAAKALFETIQYPILIHCKSGADRAGLMSVLYMYFVQKQPMDVAVKQLSIKYGHFRWANTGKLDFFFDAFFQYQAQHPTIEFLEWVTTVYNRDELDKQFQSSGWANIIVHKILRRE